MPGGDAKCWLAGYGWPVALGVQDFGLRLALTALRAVLSLVFERERELLTYRCKLNYLATHNFISSSSPLFLLPSINLPTEKKNIVMSIAAPIITFKAGICDLDVSSINNCLQPIRRSLSKQTLTAVASQTSANPPQVKPKSTPGYIYLYSEDDLIHFCWRPRSAALTDPELDLVMVPSDGTFTPYRSTQENTRAPTNGRIYVLKFSSSSQRYLFWLQSKSQNERDLAYFSPRDLKLGEIVNTLLQGEEVDVQTEIANLPSNERGGDDGDDDATMEDVEGSHHTSDHHGGHGSGGAGFDATGGDIREEGEESREGGADGGRA